MKKILITLSLLALSACGVTTTHPEPAKEVAAPDANTPFTLTVVDCDICNAQETAQRIKDLAVRDVQIIQESKNSEEGKRLIEKFNATTLPLFIFNEEIKNSEVKSFYQDIAHELNGEFLLKLQAIGLETNKEILKSPEIQDYDYRTHGNADAPIQIIEYSDFECPFCKNFYETTYKQIKDKYGDQVSFIYKNLPLESHKYALKAAQAVQCAADQDKFVEMHDMLFEKAPELSKQQILDYADKLELNGKDFLYCLDAEKKKAQVREQKQEAFSLGIRGTPAFVINGSVYIGGAYPFKTFEEIIDTLLDE